MNAYIRTCIFFLVLVVIVSALTGCRAPSIVEEVDLPESIEKTAFNERTELKLFLFGEEGSHYNHVEEVFAYIEEELKDSLNITINITWTPNAVYKQRLPMWIAAAEEMDLVFDAPWVNMDKMAIDGAYIDLTKYFNNPQYPGLMKAFHTDFINNNKLFGKLYGIPMANTFMDMEGIAYRKDLLHKYAMDPIESYDDLYDFLVKVSENEKDMTPYGVYGKKGFFKLFQEPSKRQLEGRVFTFLEYIDVAIDKDGKSVIGIAAYGDPDEAYSNFPAEYGKDYILSYYKKCREFEKFIATEVMANSGDDGKETAAWYMTLSGFMNSEKQLKARIPEAELAFWPIYENSQNLILGGQATDYKAWNFLCVPYTSKKAHKTMEFLDWVYASPKNNDLIVYGIEGKHWTAVGDREWKPNVDMDTYIFPAYQLGWSPIYQRMHADLPDDLIEYMDYQFREDTFTQTAIAGFTFNQEPVKIEIARCAPIIDKYFPPLSCGLYENIEEKLIELNNELRSAGVDNIKVELQRQLNDFLAQNR